MFWFSLTLNFVPCFLICGFFLVSNLQTGGPPWSLSKFAYLAPDRMYVLLGAISLGQPDSNGDPRKGAPCKS